MATMPLDAPTSMASAFFASHRELFDFDLHVGVETITAATPSFLGRYQECQQRQTLELARQATTSVTVPMMPLLATVGSSLLPIFHNADINTPAPYPPRHRSPQRKPHDPDRASWDQPPSPSRAPPPSSPSQRRPQDESGTGARSPSNRIRPGAPGIIGLRGLGLGTHEEPPTKCQPQGLPRLADLLIDASARVVFAPSRRMDEAKKIELLLGSKCVGRISAASANVPPAIRRRLEASARVGLRRERLYAQLVDEYHRHCSGGT